MYLLFTQYNQHFHLFRAIFYIFIIFYSQFLGVLMNNIGEPIHTQVIDTSLLPVFVKIVEKKVCQVFISYVTFFIFHFF